MYSGLHSAGQHKFSMSSMPGLKFRLIFFLHFYTWIDIINEHLV